MPPNADADSHNGPSNSRRVLRPELRQATLILPTGKRVRRNVTFGPSHEPSPILSRQVSQDGQLGWMQHWGYQVKRWIFQAWAFANSRTGQGVFKCSIAYLLGSLATFVPQIAALLGQQDGKHMVATITVYFHPARSTGSMFEAIICATLAFAYAVFISFSSMGLSIFFGRTLDRVMLGHILVLIIFCGGGLGFVGWIKQRLDHPLVNISCSLTSLAIITVLTKEGAVQASEFSDDKVIQVMIVIVMGVCATTAVSFLISPVSARTDLKDDLAQVTDSFADLLTMITRSFLTGQEEELRQKAFENALSKYKKLSTSLTKNLKEAKYEHYVLGTERQYQLNAQLVGCMQRLGQNIGGLRSAATTEFWLLAHSEFVDPDAINDGFTPRKPRDLESYLPHVASWLVSPTKSHDVLESIDETPEDTSAINEPSTLSHLFSKQDSVQSIETPAYIFSRFIVQLGPSMKSLAVTLRKILDELPFAIDGQIAVDTHFKLSLADAIKLYTVSRQEALQLLYKGKELTEARSMETQANFEEVAASCGYFSFSLLDFAYEMQAYLDILDDLKLEIDERQEDRTWNWLKFWQRFSKSQQPHTDAEQESLLDHNYDNEIPTTLPDPTERVVLASNTKNENITQTYRYKLWLGLSFFRRDDIKFAVKVGVGAALYALPSFLPSTRPIYQHWRGEWGLLSYMIVCAMTLGASNTTGYARFLGTCIGAACAIATWIVSGGNVYLLAFFGWIMSLWTAYIIIAQGKGPMGRFIMLTYNLSALYAYSLSVKGLDGDGDEGGIDPNITEIALHRVVAVLSGCLWGLITTRLIFPISARAKFKENLSILWLHLGLIWKRDPLNLLLPPQTRNRNASPSIDLRSESSLHNRLTHLETLLEAASSEIHLRAPFPSSAYNRILKSTSAMIDACHALHVMILKNPRVSKGEVAMLTYTARERGGICQRLCHQFQVLAGELRLEVPLGGEALPGIEGVRDRFLSRVWSFRWEGAGAGIDADNSAGAGSGSGSENGGRGANTDEDFEFLYAYALVTGQLSREIRDVGVEIEGLFGGGVEDMLRLL